MSGRGLLKSAVGVLFGACTIGAFLPVLLIVSNALVAGILVFVLGGTLILSVTAQDVRQAVGRSLVTLGSALMMLPILSLLLGVLLVAPRSDATAKGDKSRELSGPSSHQIIAACVAFGAGSLVAMAGLVIIINGQRDQLNSSGRGEKTKRPLTFRPMQDKVASGVAVSAVGEVQAAKDGVSPEAGDQSGKPSATGGQAQDSPELKPAVSRSGIFEADAGTRMRSAAVRTLEFMSEAQAEIGMVGTRSVAGMYGSLVGARMRTRSPRALPTKSGSDASGKRQSAGAQEPLSKSARITKHLDVSKRLRAAVSAPRPVSDEAATQIRQADAKMKPASRLRDRLEAAGYSIRPTDFSRPPAGDVTDKGLAS